jgi:hypothetical protein
MHTLDDSVHAVTVHHRQIFFLGHDPAVLVRTGLWPPAGFR